MPVYPQGSLNTAALGSNDIYVVIVPPQNVVIQGIATNIGGIVGSGAWGPVNTPVLLGSGHTQAGELIPGRLLSPIEIQQILEPAT